MDWLKNHTDSMITLGAILGAVLWMNTQFNEIDRRFSNIEKDLAVIKAVLVMKGIMPNELAVKCETK